MDTCDPEPASEKFDDMVVDWSKQKNAGQRFGCEYRNLPRFGERWEGEEKASVDDPGRSIPEMPTHGG